MTMGEISVLPVDRLVSEVAVDPVHVRELADSIRVSGPITPVTVRRDTQQLIDGFHRVAAMQELGFKDVACILMACDDETFWDLRIMMASTHKAVTFARAVEWIEECFSVSPLRHSFKSAFSLFDAVSAGYGAPDAKAWVENKCQKWGLKVGTIRNWLYTQQSLAPELVEEAKRGSTAEPSGETSLPFTHYYRVAETLPNKPDLQQKVIDKAKEEGLSGEQTRDVARAVSSAPDAETAQFILRQTVSRTTDELTRAARVDQLLSEPKRPPTDRARSYDLTGVALFVYQGLEQQLSSLEGLTDEVIANLSHDHWARMTDMMDKVVELIQEKKAKRAQPVAVSGRVVEGLVLRD